MQKRNFIKEHYTGNQHTTPIISELPYAGFFGVS
jgi:hypothetical protein